MLAGTLDSLNGARLAIQSIEKIVPATVGRRLQNTLRERGIKHAELATMTGLSVSAIQRFLSSVNRPPESHTLIPIMNALELSHDERDSLESQYHLEREANPKKPKRKPF